MRVRVSLISIEKGQRDYSLVNDADYTIVVESLDEIKDFVASHKDEVGVCRGVEKFFDWEEIDDITDDEFDKIEEIIENWLTIK